MADLLPSTPDTSAAEEADPRVVGLADDDADDLLSALSSSTARELLSALHEDPAPPSKLADAVDTSVQNAQYHLGNLEDAGLVEVIDTAYSSKGREMDVYAPTDRPLVVVAGDEDDGASLRTALSRFLGGLGVLSISSLVVEGVLGEWSLLGAGDDGTPLVVDDETDDEPAADADEEDEPATEDPDDGDAAEADDPDGEPDEEYDSDDEPDEEEAPEEAEDPVADPDEEEADDEVEVATEDEEDADVEEEQAEDGLDEADDDEADDETDDEDAQDDAEAVEGDDAIDQPDAEEDVAEDETEEFDVEDDVVDVTADDVPDADAPPESAELLAEAPDEALGLPPGFLFFLGGAIVLTASFAIRYWRIVR